jgi:hypothetical protein
MKYDGTKIFTDDIVDMGAYDLTVPYDITTLARSSDDFSDIQNNSGGFFVKPDGTRFYTSSISNNFVYQYSYAN